MAARSGEGNGSHPELARGMLSAVADWPYWALFLGLATLAPVLAKMLDVRRAPPASERDT